MKNFTLMQRIRNKVRIKGKPDLFIAKGAKIVNCDIEVKGTNNKLTIEEGTNIRNTKLELIGNGCLLIIGKNSIVGQGSYLSAKDGLSLIIKEDCMLSRNVKIMTSDGHPIYQNDKVINSGGDIVLENNVWAADSVTILKGLNIGSHSVLGINATVTKNIPSHSIAVGNPAKVVKGNITWAD